MKVKTFLIMVYSGLIFGFLLLMVCCYGLWIDNPILATLTALGGTILMGVSGGIRVVAQPYWFDDYWEEKRRS